MASDESKQITLKSSDGEEFVVDEEVAKLSQLLCNLIENTEVKDGIKIPLVNSKILAKVIKYCKKHVECAPAAASAGDDKAIEEELRSWDSNFVKVDQATLFGLIQAANYLDIGGLFGLCCQKVAAMIEGKTTEEMRETFNIKNDFTPEEEEEVWGKKRRFDCFC